jgi:hypothetical protein
MHSTLLKKVFLFITMFITVTLACDLSFTVAPSASPTLLPTDAIIPATVASTEIPAALTPIPATLAPNATPNGVEVSVGPLSLVLSSGLAGGVRGSQVPRNEGQDLPDWDLTPGHIILKLEGYLLQGKSHEPQIYVYPAQAYAEMVPSAFESIRRLDNIVSTSGGPMINDQLPAVPFFNGQQSFASNIQLLSFQNGGGVRFLTEYAQYAVSANNHDLFYHFQGVTRDGAYYIIAILPISNPMLAETSDGGAVLPTGGVPYPYFADPEADMQAYFTSVIDVLNATPSEAFSPTMDKLDLLIQSMRITP